MTSRPGPLVVLALLALTACDVGGDRTPESLIRLGFQGPARRVTVRGDTRQAEISTVPVARLLCRQAASGGGPGTVRVALATQGPGKATVHVSLTSSQEVVRDVPVPAAWTTVEVAIGPAAADCAELTITGDPRAHVAIAEPTVRRPGARRPWVVVYVFDTLRFDQLVAGDGTMRAIPAFVALAHDGLLYERAFSNSSWTRPSVASLLTGVGPSTHGVYDFADRIRADLPSLAVELAAAGYRTVALSTNPNVLPIWGFDIGFDRFVDLKAARPTHVLAASFQDVVAAESEAPLFLLVHDNGPHAPYFSPRDFTPPVPPPPHPSLEGDRSPLFLWGRYDAAVQFSSRRLSALVDLLRQVQRYDDAIMVVLGDHGESFGEDGHKGHATALSGVQIHVPLLLKAPRDRRLVGRVPTPVSIAAVAPTILALLDLPRPEPWAARTLPLAPTARAARPPQDIVSELDTPWGTAVSLIRWPWKYLRDGNDEALFHLARDPAERENVADRHPAVATRLRAAVANERRPVPDEVVLECVAGWADGTVDGLLLLGTSGAAVRFASNNLEPDDRVVRRGTDLHVTLNLPRQPNRRGAGSFVRDRDRIYLTGVSRARIRIRLTARPKPPELLGPRGRRLPGDGRPIELADVTTATHLGLLDGGPKPRCRLHRTTVPTAGPVEPIPGEVEERLRALGYL